MTLLPSPQKLRRGVTLVELLTVVAIITLLIQLLLPAVMHSKELARQTQCRNNLRQIALGMLSHEQAHQHFPTGGWNWRWIGEADKGYGKGQPGGWVFNTLTYIESESLRQLSTTDRNTMIATAVPLLYCPSRRRPMAYPSEFAERDWQVRNAQRPEVLARTDYAVNGGTVYVNLGQGPLSHKDILDHTYEWPEYLSNSTGIAYPGSTVSPHEVRDGLTKTYLVGEKYLVPTATKNGSDPGDDGSAYQGDDMDITRWARPTITDEYYRLFNHPNMPRRDSEDFRSGYSFGSAHSQSWNVALCDGSVAGKSYDAAPEVHAAFGAIADESVNTP